VLPRRSLLAAPALLTALGASEAEAQQAQPLRIGMSLTDIPRLWGGPEAGFEGLRFGGYLLYDALVLWNLSHADRPSGLTPGLATEWRVDDADRRRWIFTLRRNVRFHDGSPFDADAAIWNFDSIFNSRAPQFDGMRAGLVRTRLSSLASYEKLDDHRIAITTHEPDGMFPFQCTFLFFASPVRRRELGGEWTRFLTNPSGTGPYRFASLVPRQRAELDANRDYWDERRIPKAPRTALLPVPDGSARVAALRANQLDVAETLPPDAIPSLRAARVRVEQNAYPHVWAWRLNLDQGSPLADLRVRQAMNLAVDREGMVALLQGSAAAARGKVMPGDPWWGAPNFHIRFDRAEARRLMQAAGYGPNRRLPLSVVMATSGGGQMVPQPMNEAIQADLREIWIDVTFQIVDFVTILNLMRADARDQHRDPLHRADDGLDHLRQPAGESARRELGLLPLARRGRRTGRDAPELRRRRAGPRDGPAAQRAGGRGGRALRGA
jgi:ABC-type transport system substrate-binding protein